MACVAAYTDRGPAREENEDACCVMVAQTALGEVAMVVVCDGVGGLSSGELASSTVVDGFCDWFERALPRLLEGMAGSGELDLAVLRASWDALLARLDALIRSYGTSTGEALGTTFTGVLAGQGTYLLGHVGDCRAYLLGRGTLLRLTEDQTPPQPASAPGRGGKDGLRRRPGPNVILQAVGCGTALAPAFSTGATSSGDMLIVLSDGAWRRAGDEGIATVFGGVDRLDEGALAGACRRLVALCLRRGERDNLTVACLVPGPCGGRGDVPTQVAAGGDDTPTEVAGGAS